MDGDVVAPNYRHGEQGMWTLQTWEELANNTRGTNRKGGKGKDFKPSPYYGNDYETVRSNKDLQRLLGKALEFPEHYGQSGEDYEK